MADLRGTLVYYAGVIRTLWTEREQIWCGKLENGMTLTAEVQNSI